jgi:hypothetical protein
MNTNTIYEDKLVKISNTFIVVKNYYFPFIGSKKVAFDKIESITVEKPTFLNGQFRIWGTRNLSTWYPIDLVRPKRDKIFKISIIGKTVDVGFTVKNSSDVEKIFREKGLLKYTTA